MKTDLHVLLGICATILCDGCITLDSLVFNPIHCSIVGEDTCTAYGNGWDDMCVTCDEAYDWTREYPWMDGTLDDGVSSVRPIDPWTVERVRIPTEDGEGELDAYWIPSHGEVPALADTTILYQHGNFASIEHYAPRVRILHELGYNVFVWDYRGYGKSLPDTVPTPDQFLADAMTVRGQVEEWAPDSDRLMIYGYSLGSIPSVEMATRASSCALILEAPFPSLHLASGSSARVGLPEQFFSEGRYDNEAKLEGYEGSVLAMIGSQDNKFSPRDVERMLRGVEGDTELWVLDGIKHGIANRGVPEAGLTPYRDHILDFLETYAASCLGDVSTR